MLKVYFAGPDLFYPGYEEWMYRVRRLCRDAGIAPIFPENTPEDEAGTIFQRNIDFITLADGVIANLNPFRGAELDSGTVFECGVAWGLGKFVVGYVSDRRSLREKLGAGTDGRDAGGALVENFRLPLNLMLAQAVFGLAASIEEAILMAHRTETETAFSHNFRE